MNTISFFVGDLVRLKTESNALELLKWTGHKSCLCRYRDTPEIQLDVDVDKLELIERI